MERSCHAMFILITTLFVTFGRVALQSVSPRIPDEQRLYNQILDNYLSTVRPNVNNSAPLQVLFSMRLSQVVSLNERQQVLTTNVFIDQTWTDPALAWDPEEFKDVRSLRIPADQVWKPDTFIYNNADNGSTGFIHGTYIQIHHDGGVTWPVPVRLRSSCVVKIAYFPFDYQFCMVRFGSWIYNRALVDYDVREDVISVDLSTYIKNSEWELMSMRLEKSVTNRSRGLGSYPHLTAIIYLKRNTFYYLFNIIVPCVMLSMLTLMTFWLPPTSGEKVTLGLSVFLAFSMFMLLIAEEVPASSDAVPLIGIYLCVVMTMTSLSVICAVLVTNLHNRGSKLKPAPRWLATLCIRYLAIPFHVNRDVQLLANTIELSDYCQFFILHDNKCARSKLLKNNQMNNDNNTDGADNYVPVSSSAKTFVTPASSPQQQVYSVHHRLNKSPSKHHSDSYHMLDTHDPNPIPEQIEDEQTMELNDPKMDSPLLQNTLSQSSHIPLTPYKTVSLHDEVTHMPTCIKYYKQQETSIDTVISSCPELDKQSLPTPSKNRKQQNLTNIADLKSAKSQQNLIPTSQISKPQHQSLNKLKSISGGDTDTFQDHYRIMPCLTHETFCECGNSGENIWVLREDVVPPPLDHDVQQSCGCHTSAEDPCQVHHEGLTSIQHRNTPLETSLTNTLSHGRGNRRNQPRVRRRIRTDPTYENPKLVLKRARVMIAEWCTIAKVVDRMLFTLSLLATIFTYVVTLVIVPGELDLKPENVTFASSSNTGQYKWN